MSGIDKEAAKPVRSLECCCCGAGTRGRQWWNRDTGYGLCEGCAERLPSRGVPAEEMRDLYGIRGVHYDLEHQAPKPENAMREVLSRVLAAECQSCGSVGAFQVEDKITDRRTWDISETGVSKVPTITQVDAEPYRISCQCCGESLEVADDDLQALVDGVEETDVSAPAPDSLEALKAFAGTDNFRGWHAKYHTAIELARAAIARAEGRQS